MVPANHINGTGEHGQQCTKKTQVVVDSNCYNFWSLLYKMEKIDLEAKFNKHVSYHIILYQLILHTGLNNMSSCGR